MNFNDFLKDGSIKPFKAVKSQMYDLILSAENDIQASIELIKREFYGVSRDTAYEAMLKSGMALMFYHGYRPEVGSHHITTVRFIEQVLNSKYDGIVASFDRFRRTRHQRLYQGKEAASKSQAQKAIKTAKQLLEIVKNLINR